MPSVPPLERPAPSVRPRVPVGGACLTLWLGLLAGCASSPDYRAAKLPAELQAPLVTNTQTLDLSRLAVVSSSTDTIEPGDVLDVTITADLSKDDTVTLPVRVNDQGQAVLPALGPISVAGLQLEDAEAAITATSISAGLYRAPQVTVSMKRKRTYRVTVVGAVKNPGLYQLPGGQVDLLSAIVAAGGLSEEAGTGVEIRDPQRRRPPARLMDRIASAGGDVRTASAENVSANGVREAAAVGSFATRRVDLASLTSADTDTGLRIGDGSVVMVERRDPQPLDIIGLVRKPGRYEFPPNEDIRVLDALALAEGVQSAVADRIFVIRKTADHEPFVVEVSLRKAKRDGVENLRLAPGDVVSVEQTPATVLLETFQLIRFGVGATVF